MVTRAGRLAGAAAIMLALGIGAMPVAVSAAEPYIFELKKLHPGMMPAFRKIVPANLKTMPWISELAGVSLPVETLDGADGRRFLGMVCQPHDCGDNKLSFLLSADGGRAVGLLKSQTWTHGRESAFGNPNDAELALLRRAIAQ
jgi:hypothetical protein